VTASRPSRRGIRSRCPVVAAVVALALGIPTLASAESFNARLIESQDAAAKELAHTAQVAIETYATDNNGSYKGASPKVLDEYDSMIPIRPPRGLAALSDPYLSLAQSLDGGRGYLVATVSASGDVFGIGRAPNGTLVRVCKGFSLTCHHGRW
jgi:hypothetical protein